MSQMGEIVERIAIDATKFRFVLVGSGAITVECETQEEFNAAATILHVNGKQIIASYYGVPLRPVMSGATVIRALRGELVAPVRPIVIEAADDPPPVEPGERK